MHMKTITTNRPAAAAGCRTHQMHCGERTEVPLLNKGDDILNVERRHGAAAFLRPACQLHACTYAPNHASASYCKGSSLSLRSGSQDTDPRFKVCPTRPSTVFAVRPGFQRYLQLISLDLLKRFIIAIVDFALQHESSCIYAYYNAIVLRALLQMMEWSPGGRLRRRREQEGLRTVKSTQKYGSEPQINLQ